jgi:3-isopropylmalate/(R)-2-methylmalate dehydratase small subunit
MSKDITIPENIIDVIRGTAIPKPEDKQNTDAIAPARFLLEVTFSGMGKNVYYDERRDENGDLIESHPFNDPRYKGEILVVGADYGKGSSREHAPQALRRYGIRGIIAESFAGIFDGNCSAVGIVGVCVPGETITELADLVRREPSTEIEINLQDKVVRYAGKEAQFTMDEGVRQAFLKGLWDALPVLQLNEEGIRAVEEKLPYLHFE